MNPLESVRTAWGMIRAHKLRAFFTVLGTVVGVTFLIAVITLIQGMDAYMREDFGSRVYGLNTVQLRRVPSVQMNPSLEQRRAWERRPRLTFDDVAWLEQRVTTPGTLAFNSSGRATVTGPRGRPIENVNVTGASASYFQIRELRLQEGRPFSSHEADRGMPVVVLGSEVADLLFDGRSALGHSVRIGRFPYQVIGVLEHQGTLFGMSMDNVAIAPARSAINGVINQPNAVGEVAYKVPDATLVAAAMVELESLMRIRRGLRPHEANDFELETADESLAFWGRLRQIMFVALPGLVGISLVVGAVVIMNIMLVSVTDRTREIGIRKSLGARRRDILLQFLVESTTLSGFGGLVGILAGMGLAILVAAVSPIPASVAPWSIVLAILLGVGVGVAAGVYPAYRAARLDPIEALRHE